MVSAYRRHSEGNIEKTLGRAGERMTVHVVDNGIKNRSTKEVCVPIHPQSPRVGRLQAENLRLRPPRAHSHYDWKSNMVDMDSLIPNVQTQIV